MKKKKIGLDLSRVSSALESSSEAATAQQVDGREEDNDKSTIEPGQTNKNPINLFRIMNIQKNQIRRNKKNDYPIVEIKKLEWSILHFGLIEALSVHYDPESNMYELEAGERRYTAITNLINRYGNAIPSDSEEYKNYKKNVEQFDLNGIPCKVEEDSHPLYSEARLIIANAERRPDDPAFMAKKTHDLARIYHEINAMLPANEKFSINEKIASDLGIGTRQVMRNKQFGSLEPELQQVLAERVGINEGARYHTMTPDAQKKLAKDIEETGTVPDVDSAKKIYETSNSSSLFQIKEEKQKEQASISPEKAIAVKKSADVKAVLKSLNRQIKKIKSAFEEYKEIDEELIQTLGLSNPAEIQNEILAIIQELQSLES